MTAEGSAPALWELTERQKQQAKDENGRGWYIFQHMAAYLRMNTSNRIVDVFGLLIHPASFPALDAHHISQETGKYRPPTHSAAYEIRSP